jgi:hypothetical protein
MIWRNRKKISQIINDYLYLPFLLLIILCCTWKNAWHFIFLFHFLHSSDIVSGLIVFNEGRICLQHNGSILSLQIKSSSGEGGERVIWDISDTSLFADDKWLVGQVRRKKG